MGNYLYQEHTEFRIPRDQEEPARQALLAYALKDLENRTGRCLEIQGHINTLNQTVESFSLDELVECWGWSLIRELAHETDEIIDIQLMEGFSDCEEQLFRTLGPFVPHGCHINLSGDHTGGHWECRYSFTGSRMLEQYAEYPPIPKEEKVV